MAWGRGVSTTVGTPSTLTLLPKAQEHLSKHLSLPLSTASSHPLWQETEGRSGREEMEKSQA